MQKGYILNELKMSLNVMEKYILYEDLRSEMSDLSNAFFCVFHGFKFLS